MNTLKIEGTLGRFQSLQELGIYNFFTWGNSTWGNMSLHTNPVAEAKFRKIIRENIPDAPDRFVRMRLHNNDNVAYVSKDSMDIYSLLDRDIPSYFSIYGDGIITKESVPLTFTPADCAIVVITGIDKKDGKRFIAATHQGVFGSFLGIIWDSIHTAHREYDFDNSELSAYVFPHIDGNFYRKRNDARNGTPLFTKEEFNKYYEPDGEFTKIRFDLKVMDDLKTLGVGHIEHSGLDTYSEYKNGNLYSRTAAVEAMSEDVDSRLGIVIYIKP